MKSKSRPAYVIAILLVGGALVWLASLVPSEQKPDVPPTTMVGRSEPTENLSSTKTGAPVQRQVNAGRSNSIESSSAIFDRPEVPLDYFHELNKAFSWPIEFYGKVIDDQGNPVAGAEAHVSWAISPLEHGPSKAVKMTDATGSFEVTGERGRSLSLIIYKRGYYFPKGQRTSFGYAPEEGNFKADQNNPVIFRLRKRGSGVDLVTSQYGVNPSLGFHPPNDGTPVWVDFFERKTAGSGQMQISKLTPPRSPDGVPRAKEWRLTLSIPDGGFVKIEEKEFPFYPPESGYQPVLDFHFPPDREGWTDHISGQYYIAFGNPRRYGRIDIEAWSVGGVRLGYAINPDGRPYLEPKEKTN